MIPNKLQTGTEFDADLVCSIINTSVKYNCCRICVGFDCRMFDLGVV